MFGLAAPAWLAALAALAVPIAIHLWTRRPARVVRVASIRHIAGAPVSARRVRLDDPWLLLVRMALLALVATSLARPYLARAGGSPPETWVLVDPDLLRDYVAAESAQPGGGSPTHEVRSLLDSLRGTGTSIRLFASGLPETGWDAVAEPAVTIAEPAVTADAWSLLREAEHMAPAGTKLLIVAEPRLAADAGERPEIGLEVKWVAARRHGGSPAGERADDWTAGRTAAVLADAERRGDARYIAAALEAALEIALEDATGVAAVRVLPLDSAESAVADAGPADWIVWLAAAPVPDVVLTALERGATVLTDAGAPEGAATEAGATRVLVLSDGMSPIVVQQRLGHHAPARAGGAVLWETAEGKALLTASRLGAGLHLECACRFDAATSDLVLQPAFPELMARLWSSPEALRGAPVRVSVPQILPVPAAPDAPRPDAIDSAPDPAPALAGRRDLTDFLWPVALALLVCERLLAMRSRKTRRRRADAIRSAAVAA